MSCRLFFSVLFATLLCYYVGTFSVTYAASPAPSPESKTATVSATVPSQNATNDTTPPTPPILISPENGTVTNDNRIPFVWYQSTDPNGNTVTYTLLLNGSPFYVNISNLGNSAGTGYTTQLEGNEVHLFPSISIPDGSYDWQVSATDLSGNTSYSAIWHLTIDTIPPFITIIDIDHYHDPTIVGGANFDIDGPKDVNFTISTEPFATLDLTLTPQNDPEHPIHLILPTDSSGYAYPSPHLGVGVYTVDLFATDGAGNKTTLPSFTLTIHQAQITVPIPPIPGVPTVIIPYTPLSIPSLPATIAKVTTRELLPYLLAGLLAVAVGILLFILWKRKYNLLLLDIHGKPIPTAHIYHSIPDTRSHFNQVFLALHDPIQYVLVKGDRGRVYIPHLNRYSTLTIRTKDTTYILSLSVHRSLYTLILD